MANEIKKGPEVPFNSHIGGEGGITRRSAPRPFGVALTGVIPASLLNQISKLLMSQKF
jgi:hypothetical protein